MPDDDVQITTDDTSAEVVTPTEELGEEGTIEDRFGSFLTKAFEERDQSEQGDTTEEDTEKPTDKPEEVVEAKAKTDETETDEEPPEDEELEFLSKEELAKRFPNASKAVRGYAERLAREFKPVAELIDRLGGIKAVERLDSLAMLATSVPDEE